MNPRIDSQACAGCRIIQLGDEVKRLKGLAYIGDHYFDDCTYKRRYQEALEGQRKAQLDANRFHAMVEAAARKVDDWLHGDDCPLRYAEENDNGAYTDDDGTVHAASDCSCGIHELLVVLGKEAATQKPSMLSAEEATRLDNFRNGDWEAEAWR